MFIYILIDPRTNEIRYVGQTRDLAKRLKKHIDNARLNLYQTHKDRWTRTLLDAGLVPEMVAILPTDDANWQRDERDAIAHYRSIGAPLTNLTAGGEGVVAERTPEWLANMSVSQKGKTISPEQRAAISATLRANTNNRCKYGHEFTPENTGWSQKDGRQYRRCKQCARERAMRLDRANGALPLGRGQQPRRETCARGHRLEGENLHLYVRERNGTRYEERICRECAKQRKARRAA